VQLSRDDDTGARAFRSDQKGQFAFLLLTLGLEWSQMFTMLESLGPAGQHLRKSERPMTGFTCTERAPTTTIGNSMA
jgi:hypothetical protein